MVTQQAVADAAGVHPSTVSLALRNDLRLSEHTRRRVRTVAQQLGYAPDPLVSLLMSRVRLRPAGYRGTLAYLHTDRSGSRRIQTGIHRNYLAGAGSRAAELGYKLDEFYLEPGDRSPPEIVRVLRCRGIDGLIVEHTPSPSCPGRRLPFDVGPFAAVSIGVPLLSPALHWVANDQYMRSVIAARELLGRGYRRLGFVLHEGFDNNMVHRCSAGFLAVQRYLPALKPIPILHLPQERPAAAVRRWLRRNAPDAVLSTCDPVLRFIREAGIRVPEDVGFVHLDWFPEFSPSAGLYGNSEYTGMAAVEMVVSQLHRGERGPPPRPACHLIAGSWVDGATIRRVGPSFDLNATFFADVPATSVVSPK